MEGLRYESGVAASRENLLCPGLPAELGVGRKEKTTHTGRPPLWAGVGLRAPHMVSGGCHSGAFLVGL